MMTAKEYLNQGYWLNDRIKGNQKELEELKELASSLKATDYSKDVVQTSASESASFVPKVERIISLEEQIRRETDAYIALKLDIREKIMTIQNEDEERCLYKRYVLYMKWSDIAEDFSVSNEYIFKLHRKALKSFAIKYSSFLKSYSKVH